MTEITSMARTNCGGDSDVTGVTMTTIVKRTIATRASIFYTKATAASPFTSYKFPGCSPCNYLHSSVECLASGQRLLGHLVWMEGPEANRVQGWQDAWRHTDFRACDSQPSIAPTRGEDRLPPTDPDHTRGRCSESGAVDQCRGR